MTQSRPHRQNKRNSVIGVKFAIQLSKTAVNWWKGERLIVQIQVRTRTPAGNPKRQGKCKRLLAPDGEVNLFFKWIVRLLFDLDPMSTLANLRGYRRWTVEDRR